MQMMALSSLETLPLSIHWKLGTSKIDCGDKISKKPCLFTFSFSSGEQCTYYRLYDNQWLVVRNIYLKWLCYSSSCIIVSLQKSDACDKMKYQLKKSGINWDKGGIGKKVCPHNSEDLRNATGSYSQILQMEKEPENTLKYNEQIQLLKEV